jgi:hypothetical protein
VVALSVRVTVPRVCSGWILITWCSARRVAAPLGWRSCALSTPGVKDRRQLAAITERASSCSDGKQRTGSEAAGGRPQHSGISVSGRGEEFPAALGAVTFRWSTSVRGLRRWPCQASSRRIPIRQADSCRDRRCRIYRGELAASGAGVCVPADGTATSCCRSRRLWIATKSGSLISRTGVGGGEGAGDG